MSEPTSIADSANLFEANQLSKSKQSFTEPFVFLLPNPFSVYFVQFLKADISASSRWYLMFLFPSFPICISLKSKAPVT